MNLSCAANHLCRLQDSASHLPFNCVVCHSGVHAQCCTNVVNNGISLAGIVVCLLCTANANANATNANANNANANAQPDGDNSSTFVPSSTGPSSTGQQHSILSSVINNDNTTNDNESTPLESNIPTNPSTNTNAGVDGIPSTDTPSGSNSNSDNVNGDGSDSNDVQSNNDGTRDGEQDNGTAASGQAEEDEEGAFDLATVYLRSKYHDAIENLYRKKRAKTSDYKPKVITDEQYTERLNMLRNWKVGATHTRSESLIHENYTVVQGSHKNALRRRKTDNTPGKKVATYECMFVIIHNAHTVLGHQRGSRSTHTYISKEWYGITEEEIKVYILLCPTCVADRVAISAKQRPLKMIESPTVGHRGQMDLVDMSSQQDPDGYNWILRLIDHLSGQGHVRPLKQKTAEECGKAIIQILSSSIEFDILQSDNGGEFLGQTVAYIEK